MLFFRGFLKQLSACQTRRYHCCPTRTAAHPFLRSISFVIPRQGELCLVTNHFEWFGDYSVWSWPSVRVSVRPCTKTVPSSPHSCDVSGNWYLHHIKANQLKFCTWQYLGDRAKKKSFLPNRAIFNHLQYFASDYSYFPTADQRPDVLTSGVKLRIYYSCEYLLLHEVFAHYFMIFGLKKIWYTSFLPC